MANNSTVEDRQPFEVSLVDIIQFIRRYSLILICITLFSGILGIVYSFLLPRKYTAKTVLLPEYSQGGGNSFFSMAVGAERGGAEKLTPDLYPNILKSAPFGQYLLTVAVKDVRYKTYPTLKSYLRRDTSTTGVFSRFFSFGKKNTAMSVKDSVNILPNSILVLSTEQNALVKGATSLILSSVESKNGLITLECEMEDPVVAAILVEVSKDYLINYVEEYRTSKTYEQVAFLDKRVAEAKKRQQNAEFALQNYRDHNRNAFLNVARITEQTLQSEYTLSQSIYSDLIIKLEQAKIKIKEEKPVFKVLEPVKVPLDKSSPNRPIIALLFGIAGFLVAFCYIVFFREKLHLHFIRYN
jgi:uncharacterized protein involved in exopolysaccharide biosynthesis